MFDFLRKTSLHILAIPLLFIILGTVSNQAVLWANHDTFPVMANDFKAVQMLGGESPVVLKDGTTLLDDTHSLMTSKSHLNWLADVFDFKDEIESIGDIMIDFGGFMWTFAPYVWGFAVIRKLKE